jgi:hypothetical protein
MVFSMLFYRRSLPPWLILVTRSAANFPFGTTESALRFRIVVP